MPVPFFSTSLLTDDQCDELAAMFARSVGAEVIWRRDGGSIWFYGDARLDVLSRAVIEHADAHRRMYQSRPGAAATV